MDPLEQDISLNSLPDGVKTPTPFFKKQDNLVIPSPIPYDSSVNLSIKQTSMCKILDMMT